MSLPTAYLTSAKNTGDILRAIQSAQAPERFTTRFLEGLGFPSSNDRTMINVLKALGFLTDSGVPTARYHEYMDQTQSDLILAQAIREAYADLFRVNRNAQTMSQSDVKQKMKTLSEGAFSDRVLSLMASTFTTISKLADWSSPPGAESTQHALPTDDQAKDKQPAAPIHVSSPRESRTGSMELGLIYQINIQLPESRDQAVYDAIFKALREHLR
jgi:Family of unknown function (DUF5343)